MNSTEPLERVQRFPPFADLEMKGRSDGGARIAHAADGFPGGYFLTHGNQDLGGVGVERVETAAVVDDSTLAVPLEPVHVVHPALGDGRDGGSEGGRDVDPAVEGRRIESGVLLVPEGPRHLPVHGPGQTTPVPPEVPEEDRLLPRRAALRREPAL